jgi:hypothetical protein
VGCCENPAQNQPSENRHDRPDRINALHAGKDLIRDYSLDRCQEHRVEADSSVGSGQRDRKTASGGADYESSLRQGHEYPIRVLELFLSCDSG